VQEIRHLFAKHGGNLGETGCVSWMFDKKGLITVEKTKVGEDQLINLALEAGAEDVREEDSLFEVVTRPEDFEKVRERLEREKIPTVAAQITMIPKSTVFLDGHNAEQILKLTEELEELDDVQGVAANFDIPNELLERAS
jgi:transcriptional/translational regulatory protein YebC/TACO1